VVYQEENLEFESGFGNIIVVDNLPVVPREKFEKLEGVVRKIYSQIGVIKEDGLWMPVDPETEKTLGYCFIEYNTPQVYTLFLQCNLKIIVVLYCLLLVILMSIVFLVDVELYVVFLIWVWLNWAFIFS